MNICVIGGGIIGTSTAVRLKRAFPDAKITIFSEVLSPHTTGDGAAGLWLPFLDPYTDQNKVEQWSNSTFRLCERLWRHEFDLDGEEDLNFISELRKAVMLLPALELFDASKENPDDPLPFWTKTVYHYQKIYQEETKRMGFPENTVGCTFYTYIFEASKILPEFYAWLKSHEDTVKFVEAKITSLDDMNEFDFVINCTGTGAKELVGDDSIQPVSGHLLRVKAPWINQMMAYFGNQSSYIIPNRDSCVVGCLSRFNSWLTTPQPGDGKKILDDCAKYLCPSLKDAEILHEWMGLRPLRVKGVRLELEHLETKSGKPMMLIHNYGHGGSGVTTFWGCAEEVVRIVQSEIQKH